MTIGTLINGQPAPIAIHDNLLDVAGDIAGLRRESEWVQGKLCDLLDTQDEQMQTLYETRELVDEALGEIRELADLFARYIDR
jgi:hypothetical protein